MLEFIIRLIELVDQGIDPGFAASLAGLSLAAAAFFAPAADRVLSEAKVEMEELEQRVAKGESGAAGLTVSPEHEEQLRTLETTVKSTTAAQKGLIKAFLIFVWFVGYTISFDSVIEETTTTFLGDISRIVLQGSDVLISLVLLSFAGYQLWIGIQGISNYFDVNFGDEMGRAKKLLDNYMDKNNKKSD